MTFPKTRTISLLTDAGVTLAVCAVVLALDGPHLDVRLRIRSDVGGQHLVVVEIALALTVPNEAIRA